MENDTTTPDKAAPLFGFELTAASARPIRDLPDPNRFWSSPEGTEGFVWVHLDLSAPGIREWLDALPVEADIINAVGVPVQRGRLFIQDNLLYGQLRDIRVTDEGPPGRARHGGALCLLLGPGMVVTGRIQALSAVEILRERLEENGCGIATPFSWLTAFFASLNAMAEEGIDKTSARLLEFENELLKGRMLEKRNELITMRREAVILTHDMAYKRTSMGNVLECERSIASAAELRDLKRELERYGAILDDLQGVMNRCNFLLDEMRAQLEESTNRNLYILTIFSAVFMPATLIVGMWGMNVGWLPFGQGQAGFLELFGLVLVSIGATLIWLRCLRMF